MRSRTCSRAASSHDCIGTASHGGWKGLLMTSELLQAPTIWDLVRRRAELSGDRVMLLDTAGRRVTFGELVTLAERTAAGLAGLGIAPGTKVTWQLPTRIDSVVVSMALARL